VGDLATRGAGVVGPTTLRPGSASRLAGALAPYIALTKPRIIELLLVTTVPAMILAAGGVPDLWLVAAVLAGGTLAAGSANCLNCYLERDIDALMVRTARRPLVRRRVSPRNALTFGIVIGVAGIAVLALAANVLAAALTAAAALFYVLVYTLGLKRRTPQNIVIGGAAGCMPVLVGWAAVTGSLALPALVMFAIVFLWTPPHFWALAIKHRADYAAAGVPMLPVVVGVPEATRRIRRYAVALVASSILLAPVAGLGWIYAIAAAALGAGFLLHAADLERVRSQRAAMRLFRFSITYLGVLFAAVAVDTLVFA
jgi:heme o synthase